MIPDIALSSGVWHDLYAATGFAPGTPLLIYNKGSSTVFVWEGASDPGAIGQGAPVLDVPAIADQDGVTGCWVNSMGSIRLCVQEYTP